MAKVEADLKAMVEEKKKLQVEHVGPSSWWGGASEQSDVTASCGRVESNTTTPVAELMVRQHWPEKKRSEGKRDGFGLACRA
jgi:hypothetical protein